MKNPLDPFSKIVNEQGRWDPEWYSWLQELAAAITAGQTFITDQQAVNLAVGAGLTFLDAEINTLKLTSPPGLVFIQSQTISSPVGTIVFTGLDTTYDTYIFEGANLHGAVDGGIIMQMSGDNGATWYGTNEYYYNVLYGYNASASSTAFQSFGNGVNFMYCDHGQNFSGSTAYTSNFTVTARGMSIGGIFSNYTMAGAHYHPTNGMMSWFGTAMCAAGGVNAARFFNLGGGNLDAGSITLYWDAKDMTTYKMVDGVLVPLTPEEIREFEQLANNPPVVLPPPPQATPGADVLYDHENRLRALEGEPPLSQGDFETIVSGVD